MLRPKKNEEWQQKLKTFKEISRKIEKKSMIKNQFNSHGFLEEKLSKIIQNHLESKS